MIAFLATLFLMVVIALVLVFLFPIAFTAGEAVAKELEHWITYRRFRR